MSSSITTRLIFSFFNGLQLPREKTIIRIEIVRKFIPQLKCMTLGCRLRFDKLVCWFSGSSKSTASIYSTSASYVKSPLKQLCKKQVAFTSKSTVISFIFSGRAKIQNLAARIPTSSAQFIIKNPGFHDIFCMDFRIRSHQIL